MIGMLIFGIIAVVLLGALLWLAREVHSPRPLEAGLSLEQLAPLHCKHFRQVAQTLDRSDRDYLRVRVSAPQRRRVYRERRRVLRQYLDGLRDDFRRLDKLGRTVAALSPEVSPFHERQRVWLALRFHGLFWMVRARLALHGLPLDVLRQLTDMIGAQAAQVEAAISRVNELALLGAGAKLSV